MKKKKPKVRTELVWCNNCLKMTKHIVIDFDMRQCMKCEMKDERKNTM